MGKMMEKHHSVLIISYDTMTKRGSRRSIGRKRIFVFPAKSSR